VIVIYELNKDKASSFSSVIKETVCMAPILIINMKTVVYTYIIYI